MKYRSARLLSVIFLIFAVATLAVAQERRMVYLGKSLPLPTKVGGRTRMVLLNYFSVI